ncbi:MAG: peptidyl-prolyl cis-trans isomerase [bacterium]|nr:peptidyl-prolyl cis-trans isomerase [bacterium]
MKKLTMAGLVLILGLSLLAGAGCKKEQPQGQVVARVNKAVLTDSDVKDYLPNGAAGISPAQKEEFLRRWVDTELFYQEAVKKGLDKDPKVAKQLRDLKREILANQLLQKEVVEKQNVSEAEVKAYFELHQTEFQNNVRYSQIVVQSPEEAAAIKSALDGGADFAKIARERSLDAASRANGGDMAGYLQRGSGEMPLDFEEKLFALAKGQTSDAIKLFNGYFIIKVTDRKPVWPPVKFEDVREGLSNGMTMSRQKIAFDNLTEELKKTAQVETHPDLIK